jgi:alkylation response protein AidB-like acyl-CoA dehydrogenase
MTIADSDVAALRESVRRLLERANPPEVRRRLIDDPIGHDRQTWKLMSDQLGLPGLTVPIEYGGVGAPPTVAQAVFEELGAALYSGPYFASVGLAVPALLSAGDGAGRASYLPSIADGSLVATVATTEPGRGWELNDVDTTAAVEGTDVWRLSGVKAYVLHGAAADVVFVSARTDDGIGLFAVRPTARGVTIEAQPSLDLTRRLARLQLSDAPAELVSGGGDVSDALSRARDLSLVFLTAEQLGVATAALQKAVDYAAEREQFGRPIGQFQAIKHLCAEMLVDVEVAGALVSALGHDADAAADLALPAALAKALCSDLVFSVAARMIQVHGGIGFTWEHDAHLYYRRAKATELLFGDGAWQRRRVAHLLLDR